MKPNLRMILSIVLAVSMLLSAVGCASTAPAAESQPPAAAEPEAPASVESEATAAPAPEKREIRIAFSVDQLDQSWAQFIGFLEKHAENLSSESDEYTITIETFDAQSSVEKQINDIETIILKDYDALIVSCVDSVGAVPATDKAFDAGLKVITVRTLEGTDKISLEFVGAQEESYWGKANEWVVAKLEADPELIINAGLIYGAPAQTAQIDRCASFKVLAEKYPGRINILDEQYGNWDSETAMNITEAWAQKYPELNLIVTANDIMEIAAANALMAANAREGVYLVGYDASEDGIKAVQEGKIDCTIGSMYVEFATQCLDKTLGCILGTFTDKKYVVTDVYAVDTENVEEFIASRTEKEASVS